MVDKQDQNKAYDKFRVSNFIHKVNLLKDNRDFKVKKDLFKAN